MFLLSSVKNYLFLARVYFLRKIYVLAPINYHTSLTIVITLSVHDKLIHKLSLVQLLELAQVFNLQ